MKVIWNEDIQNKFIPWLIGFCDAEAGFLLIKEKIERKNKNSYYKIKYSFQIGLSIKDKQLITKINENLENRGNIYEYTDKNEIKLTISSRDNLIWLIENVFSKYPLLTKYQSLRYYNMSQGVINKINKIENLEELNKYFKDVDTFLPLPAVVQGTHLSKSEEHGISNFYLDNWLLGFLNGEVSFTTFKNKSEIIKPQIFLEHTDEWAVNFFKNHLNIGPKVQSKLRINRKPTFTLKITSKNDLVNIINFIEKHNNILGYKLIQYKNWKTTYLNNI